MTAMTILIVVLVLALIGGAVWFSLDRPSGPKGPGGGSGTRPSGPDHRH